MKSIFVYAVFMYQAFAYATQSCAILTGHSVFPELAQPHVIGTAPGEKSYEPTPGVKVSARPFWDGHSVIIAKTRDGETTPQELVVNLKGGTYSLESVEAYGNEETLVRLKDQDGKPTLVIANVNLKYPRVLSPIKESKNGTFSFADSRGKHIIAVKDNVIWIDVSLTPGTRLDQAQFGNIFYQLVFDSTYEKVAFARFSAESPLDVEVVPLDLNYKDILATSRDYTFQFGGGEKTQNYFVLHVKTALVGGKSGSRIIAVDRDGKKHTLFDDPLIDGRYETNLKLSAMGSGLKIIRIEPGPNVAIFDVSRTLRNLFASPSGFASTDAVVQNYLGEWPHFETFDGFTLASPGPLNATFHVFYSNTGAVKFAGYGLTAKRINFPTDRAIEFIKALGDLSRERLLTGVAVEHTDRQFFGPPTLTIGAPSFWRGGPIVSEASGRTYGHDPDALMVGSTGIGLNLMRHPVHQNLWTPGSRVPPSDIQQIWLIGATPEALHRLETFSLVRQP